MGLLLRLGPILWLAFKGWMFVDANRRKVASYWFPVILFVPGGAFAYLFMVKLRDADTRKQLRKLLQGAPSLAQIQRRYEAAPTTVNRISYAQALHDAGRFAEAAHHFDAVAKDDPGDREALFGLGVSLLALGQADGIEPLRRLYGLDPTFRDYEAAEALAEALLAVGRTDQALELLRELHGTAGRMSHTVKLARLLIRLGRSDVARGLLEAALLDDRDAPDYIRKRDRRWTREARRTLQEL